MSNKKVNVNVKLSDSTNVWFSSDHFRTKQIITNLIQYVFKLSESGLIEITGDRVKDYYDGTCDFEFIVSDTGRGIRPELIPYHEGKIGSLDLDENFRNEIIPGTGLQILRSIVKKLNGK